MTWQAGKDYCNICGAHDAREPVHCCDNCGGDFCKYHVGRHGCSGGQ